MTVITAPPAGLEYLPFQQEGIVFASQRQSVLIADEPGLGKTLEAIGTLETTNDYPAIVIAPAGLKINWQRELARFAPARSPLILSGKPSRQLGDFLLRLDLLDSQIRQNRTEQKQDVGSAGNSPFKRWLGHFGTVARARSKAALEKVSSDRFVQPSDRRLVSVVNGNNGSCR